MPEQKVLGFLGYLQPHNLTPTFNMAESTSISSNNSNIENNLFGAFGAVVGYLGAESATALAFERLLWPQRFYSNFQLSSVPGIALLTPMGGPMHKAGLTVMDRLFQHGLLRGPYQGHMLGTTFFPQRDGTYTMHGDGVSCESHTEPLRNFLWARALSLIQFPPIMSSGGHEPLGQAEKGSPPMLRARVTVSRLSITSASAADKESRLPFVSEATNIPGPGVFLAILTSELSAVLVAVGVLAVWQTPWAMLWVIPLFIRLLSASLAEPRERLIASASSSISDDPKFNFEIHCPQSDGNFMLVTGPSALVLQFFRHYGHPKRNRVREVTQIISIIAFISLFPLQLLVSIVWMPLKLQYVWMSYQIYVILAMHITRYSHYGDSATTEANIAKAFSKQLCGHCTAGSEQECSILFGHKRHGPETLRVDLTITYHNRFKEGQESLRQLLQRQLESGKQSLPRDSHSHT
jgi:hypothetical protein